MCYARGCTPGRAHVHDCITCVRAHTHTHTHTHARTRTQTHAHTHTRTRTRTHNTHTQTCAHECSPHTCTPVPLLTPPPQAKYTEQIKSLAEGDWVKLSWVHEYVHDDGSSFPERPVTSLEKITAEEGEALAAGAGAA